MISVYEVVGITICVKDAILMLNHIFMTAMVPGRRVADFGAIGMIERFEDESSPVTVSGLDGI
jgi:hypothetical protein